MGDVDFVVFVSFDYKHVHIPHDVWMNGEFVIVHHGEYRIQMHKGTLFWDIDGQNFFEGAFFGQYLFCKSFDGIFVGTLRNTDGDGFFVQYKNIAAF